MELLYPSLRGAPVGRVGAGIEGDQVHAGPDASQELDDLEGFFAGIVHALDLHP